MISFTFGKIAILDDQEKPDRHGVEIRFRPFGRRGFIPAIGYAFANNGASFVYTSRGHGCGNYSELVFIESKG